MANPRLHHQLAPSNLFAEDWATTGVAFEYDAGARAALDLLGHNITSTNWGGVCQAVFLDMGTHPRGQPQQLVAVSDPRKDGAPAGY